MDILKIDRSFVAGLDGTEDASALVRSILGLSATLRLETVAEGIETVEQRDALRSLGADRGQGYLFARPLSVEAMAELLSTPPPTSPLPSPSRRRAPKATAGQPAATT
jgi:EAL domain-containing protein (putative c-di-GMP-specific phosphodiesterase class I)